MVSLLVNEVHPPRQINQLLSQTNNTQHLHLASFIVWLPNLVSDWKSDNEHQCMPKKNGEEIARYNKQGKYLTGDCKNSWKQKTWRNEQLGQNGDDKSIVFRNFCTPWQDFVTVALYLVMTNPPGSCSIFKLYLAFSELFLLIL